jgi:hypothetical protein
VYGMYIKWQYKWSGYKSLFSFQWPFGTYSLDNLGIMKKKSHCFRNVVLSVINVLNYNFVCGSVWMRNLTLTDKHRLRAFENMVLRRIFGPKRNVKWWEFGENCIMRSFITCSPRQP